MIANGKRNGFGLDNHIQSPYETYLQNLQKTK
jgi:hypothetical protein